MVWGASKPSRSYICVSLFLGNFKFLVLEQLFPLVCPLSVVDPSKQTVRWCFCRWIRMPLLFRVPHWYARNIYKYFHIYKYILTTHECVSTRSRTRKGENKLRKISVFYFKRLFITELLLLSSAVDCCCLCRSSLSDR